MSAIVSILRLSRPVNLLIIAATMYALRYWVMLPLARTASIGIDLQLGGFSFFLLVLVMVLLAAAGNIINDYFDQKVDRINKPDRVIVGKRVKRRVAMVLHQVLNILAVLLTVVLCLRTGMWWPLVVPIAIATLLWWYSPVLKKLPFTGNAVVALCVAIVPLWTGWFEIGLLRHKYTDMLPDPAAFFAGTWAWLAAYAVFAFLLTLAREALKDMEDIEGDREGGYHTLPLSRGEEKTRLYVGVILLLTLALALGGGWMVFRGDAFISTPLIALLALVAAPLLVSALFSFRSRTKADYQRASRWTKVSMAGGIAFCWFIGQWLLA